MLPMPDRLWVSVNPLLQDDLRAELDAEGLTGAIGYHRPAHTYLFEVDVDSSDTYDMAKDALARAVDRFSHKHPTESISVADHPRDL